MTAPILALLRCESTRQDPAGRMATFSGKPNVIGNSFSIPISAEQAADLDVGAEYWASITKDRPQA